MIQMHRWWLVFFLVNLSASLSCVTTVEASPHEEALSKAVVKIYTVYDSPQYWTPWNMRGPAQMSGSGCIIDGHRILTNAHVVSDHTYIEVQRHGSSERVPARALHVYHDADLALLTVDDETFFADVEPLVLGELPETQQEVHVYGFPMGGDSLSVTKGVVSRFEHQVYAHSSSYLLAGQIDAAINPGNSGGPVLAEGKIVGVVMQGFDAEDADNIGYMVPVPVVRHYLDDLEDGTVSGFPVLGISHFNVRNPSAKEFYNLEKGQSGRLVTHVHPASPFRGQVQPGDILSAIDAVPIADDGTVELRKNERTSLALLVQRHQVGDTIKIDIVRQGVRHELSAVLSLAGGDVFPIPKERYGVKPSYFIYGGLVFSKLTKNLLLAWGDDWHEDAPNNYLGLYYYNRLEEVGQEVVVLLRVLPSKLTTGYHDIEDMIVETVDGKRVKNLRHLVELLEQGSAPFVSISGDRQQHIVLSRESVKLEGHAVLQTYDIPRDRSADLVLSEKSGDMK